MYLVLEDVTRASPHGYDPPNLVSGFHTFILWIGCSKACQIMQRVDRVCGIRAYCSAYEDCSSASYEENATKKSQWQVSG